MRILKPANCALISELVFSILALLMRNVKQSVRLMKSTLELSQVNNNLRAWEKKIERKKIDEEKDRILQESLAFLFQKH
jgi:hypothetical protein